MMLGKRAHSDLSEQMEGFLTEYYRQECLRALYSKRARSLCVHPLLSKTAMAPAAKKQRRAKASVSFATQDDVIGCADPCIDRRPVPCTPISRLELYLLLSQREFPAANTAVAV
ncbi:TPA: hypothetical protein N0F65_010995 [Lagenidium giganteum]|uniref:Uncharacterized protein n=1 Tax=Lagenidium giganteum TaxID=4803 RepID=A0AAV2ZBE7_9STRA|nr:TPA: hypothetical protein N0F65_010995 [Lagenidium giganteum]